MIELILNFLILSVVIFFVGRMMPTITVRSFGTAMMAALIYSVINYLVGWFLVFISFPLLVLSLGLFKFVINAFMLWITDKLMDDFQIDGIDSTLIAAVLITVISSLIGVFV